MARLLPSDNTELMLSLGESAELRTLDMLRRELPPEYTVFHSVHWSRDGARTAFGEADFVVVNRSGASVVVEQKAGALEETADGLVKRYADGRKAVAAQIHRTLDGLRAQFRQQSGRELSLDYLLYCPDHRLRDLNAAGLVASRIVDARAAAELPQRIDQMLGRGTASAEGDRVLRFFESRFHLVPDIHAHVVAGERTMVRLSGGLADTLSSIDMRPRPFRVRVRGTAGCGKSIVATRFLDAAVGSGRRPLLVCFNRSLAERLKAAAPQGARVETFYGLIDRFLRSRGHAPDFSRSNEPGFWRRLQDKAVEEAIPDDWRFDALIVDEGQDFEPGWCDILGLFLTEGGDVLWLEDPDQAIRYDALAGVGPEGALADGFIGFRAKANHRSPETIAGYIRHVLPFEFLPSNPLPGLGVGARGYDDPATQPKLVAAIVTDLLRRGFRHEDIVVLSMHGLTRATLAAATRIGAFTLARPTGEYDLLGNQILSAGQIRFDTIYRFKGEQAPAVILTDVDPDARRPEHAQRLLFSAMTRATVRLELLVKTSNPMSAALLRGV